MTWSSSSSFGVVAFCLPWLVHRNIFSFFLLFFFSISGISLQHYTTFHIFFIISSSPFSLRSYLFIPSILPVALSPGSFILSLSLFSLSSLLSFPHSPFLTSPSPFPIFLPCDFQPAKCHPRRFLSTLWSTLASASRLLRQHNLPQPTQGLRRS